MRELADVNQKQPTAVDAKGSHLCAYTFVCSSVGELGVDLVEQIADIAKQLARDGMKQRVLAGRLIKNMNDA